MTEPIAVVRAPTPPTRHASNLGLGIAFGSVAVVLAIVLVAVMLWLMNGGPAESASSLYARIRDSEHIAILDVWFSEDSEDQVNVELIGSATDRDARDVWCDVIGQTDIDRQVSVSVENEHSYWPPPSHCSDPADLPVPE